jgi:5-methylcytosine-specific restriction endonuclease McrA
MEAHQTIPAVDQTATEPTIEPPRAVKVVVTRAERAKLRKAREKEKRLARKARELVRKQKRKVKREAKAAPKRSLAAWSLIVRAGGKCQVCGATEHLNAHHILAKERYQLWKLEPLNGVCLCPTCHKFGARSAHRNPLWFTIWLQLNCPDQYAWAVDKLMNDPEAPMQKEPTRKERMPESSPSESSAILVALIGFAGSGKDSIYANLPKDWVRVSFADCVRADLADALYIAFGLKWGQLTPELKKVFRPVLLAWGNAGRALNCRHWIERADIPTSGKVCFTDTRYYDEVAEIHRRGGLIVNVQRDGVGPANEDERKIIPELLEQFPHVVLRNDGTKQETANALLALADEHIRVLKGGQSDRTEPVASAA